MFILNSKNEPKGDQPKAIKELVEGINQNKKHQVLLGVTGSGKTFTMANIIKETNRPAIILSHNKTLASQLFSEMKQLFPNNKVEYFVSHFDFYRPEYYSVATDQYREKSSKTNWDLESMRMSAMNAIKTRRDTIIVSSVAAIYGALNPEEYASNFVYVEKNEKISRSDFIKKLIKIGYQRTLENPAPGFLRVKGDVVELAPSWSSDFNVRIDFFGDEIEKISTIEPSAKKITGEFFNYTIYPAEAYTVNQNTLNIAIETIKEELKERLEYFKQNGKLVEEQRLRERVTTDLDSLAEFGFCSGIENYSRHFDRRSEGQKPYTLMDYLPEDALIFIDESHITVPQLNGMYEGDYSRKRKLVDYGFRLPSALDNRPLKFAEFQEIKNQTIFISATPGEYELETTNGEIVRQIIRPTGLLDPVIEVAPTENQFSRIFEELQSQIDKKERTLIMTATKRASEELSAALELKKIKSAYLHSELKTFERNEILRKLRKGIYDVVVGVNLLKEGIDLPEVSLIMITEADVAGFSRSKTALIQMIGRVARNDHGKAILFADNINEAIAETIKDNQEKREIQIAYNTKNNIVPKTIIKPISDPIENPFVNEILKKKKSKHIQSNKDIENIIEQLQIKKQEYVEKQDYENAIKIRDLILEYRAEMDENSDN
ncbi:excinuclease ABC subunit UvrB [Mycoplasma procyoni]|uniref:excinuclease ABC subunit UvrB n=1 Tax=Mycoplasma procyoni TaxID=568784 RepID=UPI00197C1EF2|nr:excinuclease ABC subunit UvrB [Mycoplasma procyoni]MBN3534400.1 excinuclease ABC subunit UvrB [Mycoplasma procyoni]